jgi:hypothetical protein
VSRRLTTSRRGRGGFAVLALSALTLGALAACDSTGPARTRHFAEERAYVRPLFATVADCEAAQPAGFHVNCEQVLRFRPDGGAEVMVTDILNPGRYVIRGQRVEVELADSIELPGRLVFLLSPDERQLRVESGSATFTLDGWLIPPVAP